MAATIIDTTTLLKVVGAALVGGVGVTAVFALAVYGAARSSDMRRSDRGGAASLYAVLAVVSTTTCVAAIVYGIMLTTQKT
ncbi:MAG TPA: hypothetical protein VGY97_06475 [Solirubrobacteraceae bacterium]|jgi:hypothetical protein|nr:hypothetical protein [Solirubrobacteraceae bacterium]